MPCVRRFASFASRVSSDDVWDPTPVSWGGNPGARRWRLCPRRLGAQVRRSAYKRGSIPRAVAMPSHSSLVLLPSTFRVPRWGAPVWLSSCCCLRSMTLWGLVLSSRRSASRIFIMQPDCIPSPMVIRRDDHQPGGGEKQAGLRPPPRPQLQGSSSSGLRRRSAPSGGAPPHGSVTLFFPQRSGEKGILQPLGGVLQPCGGRRTAAPWPGCSFPSSTRRRSCRARASHIQVLLAPSAAPGGRSTRRTPRGRYSCVTPGFKEQSRVHLIHAPKKTTYIITECIEINVIKHQSIYYIAEDLIQNKRINIKRTKDRRRQCRLRNAT
jgi:hypothetical protein